MMRWNTSEVWKATILTILCDRGNLRYNLYMNETTNDDNLIALYATSVLIHEMTVMNDAIDLMIGSSHTTPTMTALAEPLMRHYNVLRNELIRRTAIQN